MVKDSQQAFVGNAKVTLKNPQQGTTREVTTATDGAFVIAQVQPGNYELAVEAPGFKKFEQKDVRVSANDRVSVGDIVLTVGALSGLSRWNRHRRWCRRLAQSARAFIQRELPLSILLDVGYVGASSNHILYRINQNAISLGAAWLPQNQDPLNTNPKFDGTTSNQPNFYRPYQGYANTISYGFGGNSNYHALQVSANRRFSKSLTGGIAYTWSKAMGTTNDDYTTNVPFNMLTADYDVLNNDRTHVFVLNYVYNLPKFVKSATSAGKVGCFS